MLWFSLLDGMRREEAKILRCWPRRIDSETRLLAYAECRVSGAALESAAGARAPLLVA